MGYLAWSGAKQIAPSLSQKVSAIGRPNMLLINDGEKVLQYQKTLFERHESLAALLSYKLSKVVSRRNVCDVLLFGRIGEKFYILLRWDYVANKYQIPAKGLEDHC